MKGSRAFSWFPWVWSAYDRFAMPSIAESASDHEDRRVPTRSSFQ